MVDQSCDLDSKCKVTSSISLMNENSPYNKNEDLCSFNQQSEASNGSLLHPHIHKCCKVYHQNIRGLRNKTNELITFLSLDFPHIICLTEHHLRNSESACAFINYYNLGAIFCRKLLKNGRACIFIYETLQLTTTDLN
jgi:hypothetical protein